MVETYHVAFVIFGLAIFAAVVLPRLLMHRPMSLPIIYVGAGFLIFAIPHGVAPPNMVENSVVVEHLTELVVIVALMGAGLKIDRPFSWRGWGTAWRLLGITMPLTIGAAVLLGWWVLGLHIATAVLLGAIIAPTDPVLASDIEAGPPLSEVEEEPDVQQEHSVRFALTSEAGLNDGLAFPFTNLAIALAAASAPAALTWVGDWVLFDVFYKIVVGVIAGVVLGYAGGLVIFRLPASSKVSEALAGAEALSGTLFIYGATEIVGGYGFLAVFVGALVVRKFEWEHDYYRTLDEFAVMVERLLMAVVLVLFGGALAGGLLAPLTLTEVGIGLALLLVVRPLAGMIGLLGSGLSWPSRAVVASFGIRGIGSFYYLSHALNEASFAELELVIAAERLWALLGFVVLASVVLHGITASPVMDPFEQWEERTRPVREARADGVGDGSADGGGGDDGSQ
jgi:NhaP-type Na+/H+ or K+/H+ antiporter